MTTPQPAEQSDRERAEKVKAINDLCKWRSAFQACTPGGSEFMTPESTRDYMQSLKRETVEAKLEVARLRKAAASIRREALLAVDEATVERVTHAICPHIKKYVDAESPAPTVCHECPETVSTAHGEGHPLCRLIAEDAARAALSAMADHDPVKRIYDEAAAGHRAWQEWAAQNDIDQFDKEAVFLHGFSAGRP